jgi:hypothetical protein
VGTPAASYTDRETENQDPADSVRVAHSSVVRQSGQAGDEDGGGDAVQCGKAQPRVQLCVQHGVADVRAAIAVDRCTALWDMTFPFSE